MIRVILGVKTPFEVLRGINGRKNVIYGEIISMAVVYMPTYCRITHDFLFCFEHFH